MKTHTHTTIPILYIYVWLRVAAHFFAVRSQLRQTSNMYPLSTLIDLPIYISLSLHYTYCIYICVCARLHTWFFVVRSQVREVSNTYRVNPRCVRVRVYRGLTRIYLPVYISLYT